ncbi:ANTAR domain-containing protein [Pseudonocardia ammonioxydans]|uniref:ANTAR domain-containing protein n=1 Tax=Pseudonocardia ammonioxydans TaxID=260086 RepID=A0A1I5CVS0_PSUAM|nr:GAF and ANTAR domain-containing protein [Pseudonocardia ammonioxydans]SFN91054.1 ANTAR domain-containing protein [Pseudonocardia ammonioxydans]
MDERQWDADRDRFVRDWTDAATEHREPLRDHGFPLGPLGRQFAVLTYSLLDAASVGDVLGQIVAATVGLVPRAERISVVLRTGDRFDVAAAHGPGPAEIDELQRKLQEGPAIEAAKLGSPVPVLSRDLSTERRWARWAPAARELGVGSVLSTHLRARIGVDRPGSENGSEPARAPSGALTIYTREPHGLDDVDPDQVLLLATHASLALAATHAGTSAQLMETNLRRAVDSRDVIGQAKGILMASRNIDAGAAFDILRRTSQDLNVKLSDIAETLATRHHELGSQATPAGTDS